jgi:hypothetical protein
MGQGVRIEVSDNWLFPGLTTRVRLFGKGRRELCIGQESFGMNILRFACGESAIINCQDTRLLVEI